VTRGVRGARHLPGSAHPRASSNYSLIQKNIILVIRKIMMQFLFF